MTSLRPHLQRTEQRTQLIVDGKPLVLLSGEVHNSSASSLAYMAPVWTKLTALHCNAAILPLTWELIEPEEGRFDFSLLDGLLTQARAHEMKVIFIWFGAFKNTRSTYAPAWVKTDTTRFPRAQEQPGQLYGEITVVCEEACRCDARAFAAVMRHLKTVDAEQRTVVMMQVENEVGLLSDGIDYSPLAQAAFAGPAPGELLQYLASHETELHPRVRDPWLAHGRHLGGAWSTVFGEGAWEIFMAWSFASFVNRVATAGRTEYDLPMFANAWLATVEQRPGEYPSGGPVAHMIDIWRAAAPALALLAPDIYLDDFAGVCKEYAQPGNPLVIPEVRLDQGVAAKALYAIGEFGAICYAPFGVEDLVLSLPHNDGPCANPVADISWVGAKTDGAQLFTATYAQLGEMMPVLTTYAGTNRSRGILQQPGTSHDVLDIGGLRLTVEYQRPYHPEEPPAGGIIISPHDFEYHVIGYGFRLRFSLPEDAPLVGQHYECGNIDFLEIWEGTWRQGEFVRGRRLNGDEYQVQIGSAVGCRWMKLYRY